jgi:hypothetical protein
MVVGATHWEELVPSAEGLPGPHPAFFFAPDRVIKRGKDWGRESLNDRVAAAWHPFCDWTTGWLQLLQAPGSRQCRPPTSMSSRGASNRAAPTS